MKSPKIAAPIPAALPPTLAKAETSAITQGAQYTGVGSITSTSLKRKKANAAKTSLIGNA